MDDEKITVYNKQKVYHEKIEAMVKALIIECMKEKIPIVICSAVANTEEKTEYKTEIYGPGGADVNLSDDRFGNFLLVLQGNDKFRVIPAQMTENDNEIFQYIQDAGAFPECPEAEDSDDFIDDSIGDL